MSERRFFDDGSDANSDIQTNLYGRRNAKFNGTVEQKQYRQNKENVNIINRKKAVREQENQKAKRNTKEGREQERLDQEQELKDQKLREYLALLEQMEKIEEAKRLAEIESGQAHRNAEISVKLREDREKHKREEDQQNAMAAADRARKAAATQRDLEEQMNGPRRKYLENQERVLEQENDRARKLAAEYREREKDRSEERDDYVSYENINKNLSKGLYKSKVGDFSKSRLHNSIVVSHSGEGQMSAFDAARMEEERTTVRREEFRASKDDVRMKTLERWQTATTKEKEKKMAKDFEDHMQRLQKAKNLEKIENGKKYPEMQVKPATKLQIQNRNQKLAEKEFEDMFVGKGPVSNKGKKTATTTKPHFKAPTLPPARPHPLVEQSTLSAGFDNTTNRTNEFQEHEHEESEEEEEQPRSTTMKESSYREEDTRGRRQPDSPPKYPDHEESEEEDEEEEEPRNSELASSKKYYNESSYSQNRSGYDQTPEESTMRQDDAAKRPGVMSFGDRQRQQANAVGKSPELSSYQQESTSQYERDNYLGQSQSSGLSDSRYQRREEEQQEKTKQRRAVDNDINNYINEQEAFLQNLENHRKKLNDKLRTTTQENLPNEQPKRAAQPERQPAKSSLNSTSKTVAVQEDEAIEDLQKRAESLLSRFMQPAAEEPQSQDEELEEEEEDSLEYSPAKYGGAGLGDTKTTQNNYNEQTQSYAYSQDELEEEKEYSPEKNHQNRYRANARDDSPSELDYSMSDRGERSEKKSKGPAKVDYAVSFGTKQFVPQSETFGKSQNPFDDSKRGGKQAAPVPVKEDKKAWKMDFDMADDQKPAPPQTQTRKAPEQRERPSTSSNTKKQGELIVDDEAQAPSLQEFFQKNRKKMMEKYEQHQKEHPEKPEVKEAKPGRTKEEILKQRKAMMEYKAPLTAKAQQQNQAEREAQKEDGMNDHFKKSRKSKSKEPKPELLDRLAFGKKATVDKKSMLKLTNKNYEMLPEVKKKKEEEKKKEEQRLRRENAKKLDKEIRSKLMK